MTCSDPDFLDIESHLMVLKALAPKALKGIGQPYQPNKDLTDRLKVDPLSEDCLKEEISEVLHYLGLHRFQHRINLKLENAGIRNDLLGDGFRHAVGTYEMTPQRADGKITLFKDRLGFVGGQPSFNLCQIVLMHELTHHVLFFLNIYNDNRTANERLTDVAMIFFGLGRNAIAAKNRGVGYLHADEIGYAGWRTAHLRKNSSFAADINKGQAEYYQKNQPLDGHDRTYEEIMRSAEECLERLEHIKGWVENASPFAKQVTQADVQTVTDMAGRVLGQSFYQIQRNSLMDLLWKIAVSYRDNDAVLTRQLEHHRTVVQEVVNIVDPAFDAFQRCY